MAKKNRKKQAKERKHKERMDLKKKQLENRIKLQNGEPIKIKIKAKMPSPNEYKAVLESNILDEKIAKLKSLDLQTVSDDELRSAIIDVISFKTSNGVKITSMISSFRKITNKYLFRVRTCNENCMKIMKTESDAWNPPPDIVKIPSGRVNKENESLLYVAESIETAIKEMKIPENECFWLITYAVQLDINVINIGDEPQHTNEYSEIHKKIADFLRKEFTRTVERGKEYEYRISQMIASFFYPYNIYNYDGWSYPSVAHNGEYSLCLNPAIAKEKLSLYYVFHCVKENDLVKCNFAGILNENKHFEFVPIDELHRLILRHIFILEPLFYLT
jgi:hypothetical protein